MTYDLSTIDINRDAADDAPPCFVCAIADDDYGDVVLTRKALEKSGFPVRLLWVKNGDELIELLLAPPADASIDFILLDLNMPKLDGREALLQIKRDVRLRCLPVSILSTSTSQEDIDFAYGHGANCFVSKHPDFAEFTEALLTLFHFWKDVARRPSHCT